MILFTGSALDRTAERRKDLVWIEARLQDPSTRVLVLREGKPLVHEGALVSLPLPALSHGEPLFLGLLNGTAVFAVEAEDASVGRFEEFRSIVVTLPPAEASLAATARSLFEWHRRHRFCSACGQASNTTSAGWQRVCPACGAEHFPRVDPVVIMLPLFKDRCLLGRQAAWPAGRMSALAGFVEPGESIEEACAREVKEEAGLTAVRVTYFASQPWPFPSSLMIGLFAEVSSDQAVPDGSEIEEVRWLTREEAGRVLAGTHPELLAPSALGISRNLLEVWASAS